MPGKAGRRTFGALRGLPSGRWQASYLGPDGVRYTAPHTFDTKGDAEGWLAGESRRISLDAWEPPNERKHASVVTFSEYATAWVDSRRTRKGEALRPRTRAHYLDLLDRLLLPTFGDLPVQHVTTEAVERWWIATGDARPTYRAHAYGLLKSIMESARKDKVVPVKTNPCTIDGGTVVDRKRAIEPATLDELATIVAAMPERLRMMVLLAAWCALRFGELAELRRGDVVLKGTNGTLKIRRGVVRVRGDVVIGKPKTSAGSRDVAIPPHLIPALEAHLKAHVEPGADALLFPADHGGNLAPSTLYRPFYAARKAAGRDDLAWHHLRHTGAVLAAQTGATLAELMGRLGHSSPGAAMRYQHVARDRDRAIADALSRIATGGLG